MPMWLVAQIEVFVVERSHSAVQTSADTLVSPSVAYGGSNFYFWAGIQVAGPTITGAAIIGPGWQSAQSLTYLEENGDYSIDFSYVEESELTAGAPAGTYTFSGTESSAGTLDEDIVLAPYAKLTSLKVTNFDELQAIDTSQPVTIRWEAFTEGQGTSQGGLNAGYDGVIDVWVDYVSDTGWQLAYSSEEDTLPDDFGLSPALTEITIPAGRLGSSVDGTYNLRMSFIRIDTAANATNPSAALAATVTGYELEMTMRDQNFVPNPWEVYNISPEGWADTQNWMGLLNVANAPWVYSDSLKRYIYIPNQGIRETGAWVYLSK